MRGRRRSRDSPRLRWLDVAWKPPDRRRIRHLTPDKSPPQPEPPSLRHQINVAAPKAFLHLLHGDAIMLRAVGNDVVEKIRISLRLALPLRDSRCRPLPFRDPHRRISWRHDEQSARIKSGDAVEGICPELRRSRNRGHRWRRHDDSIVHFDEADFVTVYSVSLTLGDFIFIA
jgi:hypothetical protein